LSLLVHLFSLSNSDHTDFILLVQVSNEFVLSLHDRLILFNHLVCSLDLLLVSRFHVASEVGQCAQLLIQSSDFIVLHQDQLIELLNLLLGIPHGSLVLFEHAKERVHALIPRLLQICYYLLRSFNLLLVILQISSDLLGIRDEVPQIFVLRLVTVFQFLQVLHTHIVAHLLENLLMLSLRHQFLLVVTLHFTCDCLVQ
jgi:hypothetical protein